MTTTLTARDLSEANYPEIVAWVQDIAQACWTVAGKNHKPAFELQENRVFEVINALSLGHTRSVLADARKFIRLHDVDFVCGLRISSLTRTKGGVLLVTFVFSMTKALTIIAFDFRLLVTFVVFRSLVVTVSLVIHRRSSK